MKKNKIIIMIMATAIAVIAACVVFQKKNQKYNFEMAFIVVSPSRNDVQNSRDEANNILKQITKENFKNKVESYSSTKNHIVGGELGWIKDEEKWEKNYRKEIFSLEEGKVSDTVFTNDIGSFIFYLEKIRGTAPDREVYLNQIVILNRVSLATKQQKLLEIKKILKKLEIEKLELLEIKKYEEGLLYIKTLKNVHKNEEDIQLKKLEELGIDKAKIKMLFEMKKGETYSFILNDSIYVFKRK